MSDRKNRKNRVDGARFRGDSPHFVGLWFAAILTGLLGCPSDPKPAPATADASPAALAASGLPAEPSADAGAPRTLSMRIEARSGGIDVTLVAPKETIKGSAALVTGAIELDLVDVTQTRGSMGVDLSSLKMTSVADAAKGKKQTDHAQAWLEVVGNVPAPLKEQYRYATFAIREVVARGEPRIDKWPASAVAREGEGGGGVVRRGAVTVKGDFGLHGKAVAKEIPMEATLTFRAREAGPSRLEMRSTAPLMVTLAEHGVAPKDLPGLVAKGLLGQRVAETAEVAIHFVATPAPKPMPAVP